MDGNLRDAFVISICVFPTWLNKSRKGESDFPKTRSVLFFLETGLSEQIKLFTSAMYRGDTTKEQRVGNACFF